MWHGGGTVVLWLVQTLVKGLCDSFACTARSPSVINLHPPLHHPRLPWAPAARAFPSLPYRAGLCGAVLRTTPVLLLANHRVNPILVLVGTWNVAALLSLPVVSGYQQNPRMAPQSGYSGRM
jgi:hypothetical protein